MAANKRLVKTLKARRGNWRLTHEVTMDKENALKTQKLRDRLIKLHQLREKNKSINRRPRRRQLSASERSEILCKTDSKCHICGGEIADSWHADHVLAHSAGGKHSVDNYLPAHGTCNNYRWDYLPEEFEFILKLGVWTRTQIEMGSLIGREIETEFTKYEENRVKRRKKISE